jgi:3-hydroxymyristoyl/3-hydroxydecanoyl-(acyl carrier protein) dehydratase
MFELVQAISIDAAAGRAVGRAHVPLSAALDDHFPGAPHVPGTWLLELAAQIAGPLAEESHYGASDQPHYGAMHHSEVTPRPAP